MPPLERYMERADELAQDIVNAWGANVQAGNAALLTPEFRAVFDKACTYRTIKRVVDNRREFGTFAAQEEFEEQAARRGFAEAYKVFHERSAATAS